MRERILLTVFIVAWSALVVRVFYFSVKSNEYYEELSSKNSTKTELIYPARGVIFDRNKKPLAINKLGFAISLAPHLSNEKNLPVLKKKLAMLLKFFPNTNIEKMKAIYMREDSPYNHEFIRIIDFMPHEQILPFFTVLSFDENIKIESTTMREYPEGAMAGHIIGYVARISKDDAEKKNIVSPNGFIGKDGLEKSYNDVLQGEPGSKVLRVNAYNEVVEEIDAKEPSKHHSGFYRLQSHLPGTFQHECIRLIVIVGYQSVENGILDGTLQGSYLLTRLKIEYLHNFLTADRRLKVTHPVFLLNIFQLLSY